MASAVNDSTNITKCLPEWRKIAFLKFLNSKFSWGRVQYTKDMSHRRKQILTKSFLKLQFLCHAW